MTPVEEENTREAGSPSSAATADVTAATDASPTLPVKALELPELTMMAAPAPDGTVMRQFVLTIAHAAGAGGGPGKDARHRGAGGKADQHHIFAVGIAHARLDRRKFDARDEGQGGKAVFRGKGRNRLGGFCRRSTRPFA